MHGYTLVCSEKRLHGAVEKDEKIGLSQAQSLN